MNDYKWSQWLPVSISINQRYRSCNQVSYQQKHTNQRTTQGLLIVTSSKPKHKFHTTNTKIRTKPHDFSKDDFNVKLDNKHHISLSSRRTINNSLEQSKEHIRCCTRGFYLSGAAFENIQPHLSWVSCLQLNLNSIQFPLESILGTSIDHFASNLRSIRGPKHAQIWTVRECIHKHAI